MARLFPRLGGIFQFGRRVYDALLAPGVYIPQETAIDPAGNEVITQQEVVEPQGALRSGTIRWAIAGVTGSIGTITTMFNGTIPFEPVAFGTAVGTLIACGGVIWKHVRSWMPVKGSKTPVPRPPVQ